MYRKKLELQEKNYFFYAPIPAIGSTPQPWRFLAGLARSSSAQGVSTLAIPASNSATALRGTAAYQGRLTRVRNTSMKRAIRLFSFLIDFLLRK
jgi:hypothetical protein